MTLSQTYISRKQLLVDNLVAKGVQLDAYSIEDNGEGVKFNVFVYNIQPGITIDYKTGESSLSK